MMANRKGQSSIELLAIIAVGMGLVLASATWGYGAYSSLEYQWRQKSAESVAKSIAMGADFAWAGATGTRYSFSADFPDGIESITFRSGIVNIRLDEGSGRYVDIDYKSQAPISGSIGASSGTHRLVFESRDGAVLISEGE